MAMLPSAGPSPPRSSFLAASPGVFGELRRRFGARTRCLQLNFRCGVPRGTGRVGMPAARPRGSEAWRCPPPVAAYQPARASLPHLRAPNTAQVHARHLRVRRLPAARQPARRAQADAGGAGRPRRRRPPRGRAPVCQRGGGGRGCGGRGAAAVAGGGRALLLPGRAVPVPQPAGRRGARAAGGGAAPPGRPLPRRQPRPPGEGEGGRVGRWVGCGRAGEGSHVPSTRRRCRGCCAGSGCPNSQGQA